MRIIYTSVFLICTLFTSSVFAVEKSDLLGTWHCNEGDEDEVFKFDENIYLKNTHIFDADVYISSFTVMYQDSETIVNYINLNREWGIKDGNLLWSKNGTPHYVFDMNSRILKAGKIIETPIEYKKKLIHILGELFKESDNEEGTKFALSQNKDVLLISPDSIRYKCKRFKN